MRHLIFTAGLTITMAGCITTGPTDEDSARLPTGVRLLDSEQGRCSGAINIDSGVGRARQTVLRPGENASFRVSDDRIEWTCVGERSTDTERVNCPNDTTHVRITRPASGEQFLLECYG